MGILPEDDSGSVEMLRTSPVARIRGAIVGCGSCGCVICTSGKGSDVAVSTTAPFPSG